MKTIQDADALLTYKIGPVYCCSPTISVEAVIMPPSLNHPPGTSQTEPGFFKHTTGMVKVVDLRARFGLPQAYWLQPGKVIVVEVESGRTGFWVDEILDVIEFPQQGWMPLGALIPRQVFSRALLLNDVIHLYADFEKLDGFQDEGYLREHIQTLIEKDVLLEAGDHQETKPASRKNEIEKTIEVDDKKQRAVDKEDHFIEAEKSTIINSTDNNFYSKNKITQHKIMAKNKPPKDVVIASVRPASSAAKRPHKEAIKIGSVGKVIKDNVPSAHEISAEGSVINLTENIDKKASNKINIKPPYYEVSNKKENNEPLLSWMLLPVLVIVGLLSAGYLLWPTESLVKDKYLSLDKKTIVSQTNKIEPVERKPKQALFSKLPAVTHKKFIAQAEVSAEDLKVNAEPVYQAKIEKDNLGITIVLTDDFSDKDARLLEEADKIKGAAISIDNVQVKISLQQGGIKLDAAQPAVKTSKNKIKKLRKAIKPTIIITHIVVKGDTLWYIAKKYVKNPFKYAELARLSKIKNPDLIYPGDRVRIIRIINKK